MTTICRLIGGAGTGKTAYLMSVLTQWLERREVNPFQIGFSSLTRAARGEAAGRAAEIAGVGQSELEQYGWFRTIHSAVYKQLGIGKELLVDDKASRQWVAQALGATPDEIADGEDEPSGVREAASDEQNALSLWDVARAKLSPLEPVWQAASEINEFLPDWDFVKDVVDKYEQAKRLDGRCDFSDILGRYAGVYFHPSGHSDTTAEGASPDLKIWFLDEWQDASALLDRCARRMTDGAEAVYLSGDIFQSVFGFGGAHSRYMMGWPADKEKVMPKSWRCPSAILELGESVLKDCTDYWDRKIAPRCDGGEIDVELFDGGWVSELDPRVPWMLIARSNAHVRRIIKKLDAAGLPWLPTKGVGGKWAAPVRIAACMGLNALEHGHALTAAEWTAALKFLPSKAAEGEIVTHGAKAAWKDREHSTDDLADLEHLAEWGASPRLVELIREGRWGSLVDHGDEFREAWQRWGHDAVLHPKLIVGTVHGVKGMECPNVALLTTTSRQCSKSMEFDETADEERRVVYVGVTRASERLLILREKCLHAMPLNL